MTKRLMACGAFAAAILLMVPSKSSAQFTVDHFGPADQVYDFVNYGAHGADEFGASSYECANIYVFHNQDPVACGACFISPNGSISLDLHTNILAAPVTGVTPTNGVIKVVYTQYTTNFCDPTAVTAPSVGLKTFRLGPAAANELELADNLTLSAAELAHLNLTCSEIVGVLSGSTNITCGSSTDSHPSSVRNNNVK